MVFGVNDYCKGAFEALLWVLKLVKEGRGKDGDRVARLIEEALRDIMNGVATDFRERLKAIA